MHALRLCLLASAAAVWAVPVAAVPFTFSTGNPDGRIATLSQPSTGGAIETETGDDFILGFSSRITSATFTGLVTGGIPTIGNVVAEIYRVFPNDSDVGRTSGPPTFTTPQVPTRVNSPSDVAFDSRSSGSGLTFTTSSAGSFTAGNSVISGINPKPSNVTGGEGPVTGDEVTFTLTFTTPFELPADHYFFVPQVQVTGGDFLWLSAAKPIASPGTPFAPDLQSWIRNANLDPDWLRIGTDIVGGSPPPTFNASFSVTGQTIPEPAGVLVVAAALAGLGLLRRRPS